MTLLELFRSQITIGSRVALTLVNGKEHRGRVAAVVPTAVVLDTATGQVAIDERLLGAWEMLDGPTPIVETNAVGVVPLPPLRSEPAQSEFDPAVSVRVAEIRARYDLGTQQLAIRRPEPVFDVPAIS